MPARRSACISLALVLILLVLPAAVDAGANGPPVESGSGVSSSTGIFGAPAVTPGAREPASADGQGQARSPAAVTASPTPSATTMASTTVAGGQQPAGTGNGKQASQPPSSATPPTPSPSVAPTATGGMGPGGDGGGKAVGGNTSSGKAASPAPAATTPLPASTGTGSGGSGKGGPGGTTVTTTPAGARATSTSTATLAGTGPVPAGNGPDAPRAAETSTMAIFDTRGAAVGSHSGSGTGAGHGPATVGDAAGNRSGGEAYRSGDPASRGGGNGDTGERTGATPTVGPSTAGARAFRAGAAGIAPDASRAGRNGAGHAGGHGGPRERDAGERRGPPDPPAAAPVRAGPDPVDRSKDEGGRGRRGLPPYPLSADTGSTVPDPLLLLRFLVFLGYRRLRPGTLLDHPLRRSLAGAIAADPGLDLAACVAATGANRETLRYHLALLVCGGKVVEETRNGSVRYFPHDPELSPVHRAVIHFDRNPSLAPALRHIRDRPGIPRRELAGLLGVAGPTVTRQVQRLVEEGLVENRGIGLAQGYWLTPEAADAVAAITRAEAERNRVLPVADAVTA